MSSYFRRVIFLRLGMGSCFRKVIFLRLGMGSYVPASKWNIFSTLRMGSLFPLQKRFFLETCDRFLLPKETFSWDLEWVLLSVGSYKTFPEIGSTHTSHLKTVSSWKIPDSSWPSQHSLWKDPFQKSPIHCIVSLVQYLTLPNYSRHLACSAKATYNRYLACPVKATYL